jgi:hypothetical protein
MRQENQDRTPPGITRLHVRGKFWAIPRHLEQQNRQAPRTDDADVHFRCAFSQLHRYLNGDRGEGREL